MSLLANLRSRFRALFKEPGPSPEELEAQAEEEREAARQEKVRAAHLALLQGVQACTAGQFVRAMASFQDAFIAFSQAQARDDASLTQKVIGLLFIQMRGAQEVRDACVAARSALEQAGMRDEAARILMFLGDYETENGEPRNAPAAYRAALHLCRMIRYVDGEVDALCRYAAHEAKGGRPQEGQGWLDQAKVAAQRSKRDDLLNHIAACSDNLTVLAAPVLFADMIAPDDEHASDEEGDARSLG